MTPASSPAQPPRKSLLARAFLLGWLLLGIVAVIYWPQLKAALDAFKNWVAASDSAGPYAYMAAFVGCCLFLFPSPLVSLAIAPLFGFSRGLLYTLVAANLGATLAFWLGRTLLRARVERWAQNKPRFRAVDEALAANGTKVVALVRMSPLFPFTIFNYLFSLMRVSYPAFALGTFIGILPLNAAYLYLGCAASAAIGEASRERIDSLQLLLKLGGIAMALLALAVLSRLAARALRVAPQRAEDDSRFGTPGGKQ